MGGYDELVHGLYEAGLDPTQWSRVGSDLCQLVGAEACLAMVQNSEGRPSSFLAMYSLDQSAASDYMTHYWRGNPLVPVMMSAPLHIPCRFTDVYPALERAEVFQDWAVPNGLVENAGWRGSAGHAGEVLAVSVSRNAGPAFGVGELAVLTRLAPHVTQAARLQTSLSRARVEAGQLRALADTVQLPTLLLGTDGRLIEANGPARDWLRQADVLHYAEGRIRAVDPTSDQQLARAIEAWCLGGSPQPVRLGPTGALAFILSYTGSIAERAAPAFLLVITPSTAGSSLPSTTALSPRLQRVLELLLQGSSDKDIADALQITHASARTYVTRVYGQLGVRGRGELWRRYGNAPHGAPL